MLNKYLYIGGEVEGRGTWRSQCHARACGEGLAEGKCSPENWMAKPCLLVKKSVLNCRTTELKVLCRSLGKAEPLSSFSRTPLSTGPSQMRSTSWTSSVSNTRKWSLDRDKSRRLHQAWSFPASGQGMRL